MRKKMPKNAVRVLAIVLAALLVVSALFSAIYMIAAAESEDPGTTQYEITAYMRTSEQALSCEQTTVYTNGTDGKLSQLFFACYPNALRRQALAPFDEADWDAAYPNGYAPGGIQFSSVRVNGAETDWGVQGDDETLLRVEVDIEKGQSATVELVYDLLLPVCSGFCGVGAFDWRLTNAFPTVCPYRNGGLVMNPALSVGGFAFAEAADWSLSLTAPKGWECAGSGVESSEGTDDGQTTWKFRVQNARDMGVVFGRRYTLYGMESRTGRAITVYCNDSAAAKRALDIADEALAIFEGWFGAYPYPDIDIVMSQYCMDSLSSPGLILLNRDLFGLAGREELEYRIAFMLAKQFFGEMVVSDPCDEAWLSDGLTAFCALLYYRERYGEERFLRELNARVKPSLQLTLPGGVAPDSPASYFNSRYEYDLAVCGRGAAVLYELCDAMGADAFLDALRRYAQNNAFRQGTIEAFASALGGDGDSWGRFLVDALSSIGEYADQVLDWYE